MIEWHKIDQHIKDELVDKLRRNGFLLKSLDSDITEFGMLYAINGRFDGQIAFHDVWRK